MRARSCQGPRPHLQTRAGFINLDGLKAKRILINRQDIGVRQDCRGRFVDLRQVGKRSLECLIRVGALEAFGARKALLEALDQILAVSNSHLRAAQSGQMSFFGNISGVEEEIVLPPATTLDRREQLEWERELIGLYVSDHPITPFLPMLQDKITHFSAQLPEAGNKDKVVVAGMVTRFRNYQTKNGKSMGFVTIEDIQGTIELVVFPSTWDKYHTLVRPDQVLLVEGKLDVDNGDPKVLVDKISALSTENLSNEALQMVKHGQSGRPKPAASNHTVQAKMPTAQEPVAPRQPEQPTAVVSKSQKETGSTPETWQGDEMPEPPEFPQDEWNDLPPEPEDWSMELTAPDGMSAAPIVTAAANLSEAEPALAPPNAVKEPIPALAPLPQAPLLPVSLAYIMPPVSPGRLTLKEKDNDQPRMVTVILRESGDKNQDARRLRRLHGRLLSSPGKDHFTFMVFEKGACYLVEFPNDTTGISPELLRVLIGMVGEENVRVEPIKIQ